MSVLLEILAADINKSYWCVVSYGFHIGYDGVTRMHEAIGNLYVWHNPLLMALFDLWNGSQIVVKLYL